jgi:arginine-tRNA-protein transferase
VADDLTGDELEGLLARGWRKFGPYFFRPICPECRACVPIRVPVETFHPTRSQKRNRRKNADLTVRFGSLEPNRRGFEIYRDHSLQRFDREVDQEDFLQAFYLPSCPALQSNYFVRDHLVAVGFLDRGTRALSSVYFIFDTAYSSRGLGTHSVLREIEYCRDQGLTYYYLGYYIGDCRSMAYKGKFSPHELLDWDSGRWRYPG